MKKTVFIFLAVVLVLASCGLTPNYTEDDLVEVKGRLLNPDGTPYAMKEIGMWIFSLEGFSLANYWYADPDDYEITDSLGYYSFLRKGDHFMTGTSANYIIIANVDSIDGAIAGVGFYPYELVNEIPEMTLWDGDCSMTTNGTEASFSFTPITGDAPAYYNLAVRKTYYDLWVDSLGSETTYDIDNYVFQNFGASFRAGAFYPAEDQQRDFAYIYYSGVENVSIPYSGRTVLSAGKKCYAEGLGDSSLTLITNQVWHEWQNLTTLHPSYLIIDLESNKDVDGVVVYGLTSAYPSSAVEGGLQVFVSADTLSWGTALKTSTKDHGYIKIDGFEKSGRYVKIAVEEGSNLQLNTIREITVFGN